MSWELKESLRKIGAKEQGACVFSAGVREKCALVYPNSYFVGMSNLGMQVIYEKINDREDTMCERFFLPDKKTLQEH